MTETIAGVDSSGALLVAGNIRLDGATLAENGAEHEVSAALVFLLGRTPDRDFDTAAISAIAPGLLCRNREFVVGAMRPMPDVANLGIVVLLSGVPVQTTSTAAIEGGPLNAFRSAVVRAAETGVSLQPGSIVLTALPTTFVVPHGARISLEIEGLGRIHAIG